MCNYCCNSKERCARCLRGQINRLEYEIHTAEPLKDRIKELERELAERKAQAVEPLLLA